MTCGNSVLPRNSCLYAMLAKFCPSRSVAACLMPRYTMSARCVDLCNKYVAHFVSSEHGPPDPPHTYPEPNHSEYQHGSHDDNHPPLVLKRVADLQTCNLADLLIQMPTLFSPFLLSISCCLRLSCPVKLPIFWPNGIIGLNVPSRSSTSPRGVVVILIGLWIEPGRRKEVSQVGR